MNTVLYFVKNPVPGKVKTRLAKSVGAVKAAELYRDLAAENFHILKRPELWSLAVTFDPPEAESEIADWLPGAADYTAQQGADLGSRLQFAFEQAFQAGANKVLALGSDTLGLEEETIRRAFDALNETDLVIGPARDGGYYLIGMKELHARLFDKIAWSTHAVYRQTLVRARLLRLDWYELPILEDLDEEMSAAKKGESHEAKW